MKTNTLLLSLLFGSSALLAAEPASPSHPGMLAQDLQHGHEHNAMQHSPKPPRLVSPHEFEKIQAKLYAERNQLPLPSHLVPDADKAMHLANRQQLMQQSSCTSPATLLPLTGAELVSAIEGASLTSCLYGLYDNALLGSAHFSDAKILTVVQAISNLMASFDGSDATGAAELEKLVSYLRAMHWVEAGSNRQFSAAYLSTLQQAFDQYFAGSHFVRFDGNVSRNFMLRYEMLILVNSSGTDALRYLARFSQALKGYSTSVSRSDNWGVAYEENGLTQVLTHYFNATNNGSAALQQLLVSEPQIISNLRDFVLTDGLWLVGHTREYQWSDAVTELGRLLKFGGAIAQQVRPAMQTILSTYQFNGNGSNGWVIAQGMVKLYDSGNCQLYGDACEFDLESTVLSGQHTCGDTLKLRYQQPIAANNLQQICSDLAVQEQSFHAQFGNSSPVANDNNTALEMVIFSSSADYQNYAGTFFNIDTNNGGMYLEGTPSDPNNQARFIAYQATWLQPEFVVWNLEHEYVHYLDGRFNQWGSFSDQPTNLVWWGEGLAEYSSKGSDNPTALAVAADKTYQLSELFQTTYANSNTARTYYWGYLATRFMFERQRQLIDTELLPSMRAAKYVISDAPCSFDWGWQSKNDAIANNWSWLYDDSEWSEGNWVWTCGQINDGDTPQLPDYTPYAEIIAAWGNQFDAEFHQWLDCIVANDDCSNNTNPVTALQNGVPVTVSGARDSEQHYRIALPENAYDLSITTTGGSGDLDLYVRQQLAASLTEWDFRPYAIGNRERVNVLQPQQPDWFVMLHGYRQFTDANLTASWKLGNLTSLQQWPALSSNYALYQWVYVPPHAKALYFTLSNGTGDAQLYVKRQGWPTPGNYDGASSISRGTTQKIHLPNIVPGSYYHIMVNTLEGFNNVDLKVFIVE
ncbi:M9 family metallopeptidase [Rheinheimera maricola]|uniref:microbial collagenase n=1 Tax=Rheinheimera maricola TaxID=2793282 RepID=A0ABS7X8S5_9GAMM|nr:M9 family metallopeptidase [Rheinheimera maricola]MBZ9611926.1 M9 family metallopeptidase [Rheinheimera maricola]